MTFRRWQKPRVKPGGRYRCHPIGVLEVDRIEIVRVAEISEQDARASGFESRVDLFEYMRSGAEEPLEEQTAVYRIQLHHGGDGDRVTIALDDTLTTQDIAELKSKLARLDDGAPWTKKTLALIEAHPRIAASKLALKVKRETLEFKTDVRKLKRLGLTQSFEVGYEVSPRGRAYLAATRRAPKTQK